MTQLVTRQHCAQHTMKHRAQHKTQQHKERHDKQTFSDIGCAASNVALDQHELLVVDGYSLNLIDSLRSVGQLTNVVLAQAEQDICVRNVPAK